MGETALSTVDRLAIPSGPAPQNRTVTRSVSFAGANLCVVTDSPAILAAARATFAAPAPGYDRAFHFQLMVERRPSTGSGQRQPDMKSSHPCFRGRDHLVLAAYGGGAMLFDLLACRAVGRFTEDMARDESYWRRVIFPVALGVITASIGVAPLHCATLVRGGRGVHICGLSGAGKSTLSVALAQRGLAFLSDDWTYFARTADGIVACGLPVPVKLLPDARRFFPALSHLRPEISLNGELAFEVDPVATFSVTRVLSCSPEHFIFLERRAAGPNRWYRLSPRQVQDQFQPALERMPDCLLAARKAQHAIIAALSKLESWLLVCSGDPHEIAAEVDAFTARHVIQAPPARAARAHFQIPDLMRRFTPTPFVGDIATPGISVRVETDIPDLFPAACLSPGDWHPRPPILCTVVKDEAIPAGRAYAGCDGGLSYQVIPGEGCLISDQHAGRLIAFVSEARARHPEFLRELIDLGISR